MFANESLLIYELIIWINTYILKINKSDNSLERSIIKNIIDISCIAMVLRAYFLFW